MVLPVFAMAEGLPLHSSFRGCEVSEILLFTNSRHGHYIMNLYISKQQNGFLEHLNARTPSIGRLKW
jgi:hypothetical protein